jgi:predicted nucleic acid-binding Zn ribbon protein
MYCSACGSVLAPGNSFCNRCGMSLKERSEARSAPIVAFLTAITLLGIVGLGIMLGGALTLSRETDLHEGLIGFFMLFTFLIVAITEILLVRQLSRFTASTKTAEPSRQAAFAPEFQTAPRALAEPLQSVTENTTRTLEYSARDRSS